MTAQFMIYGANGYTGELIARGAVQRGLRPVVAGRREEPVAALARELELPHRVFGLDEPNAVRSSLADLTALVHAAGPFAHTWRAMIDGCLDRRVHYLDVTGEVEVFEGVAAQSDRAREAGIMMLPGAGFDVVPSDCLAAHLKSRLPSATHLALGFQGTGGMSRGTATTMAENVHRGGLVRRDGRLTRVPAAWRTRTIDFGRGPTAAMTIPWGDVSTAYHSTGIPNIEVYMAAPVALRGFVRASRYLGWLLGSTPVQRFIKGRIDSRPSGPDAPHRQRARSYLWGEAHDDTRTVVSRLTGPDGYELTALTTLAIVEKVLGGEAPAGFQTPSLAYGKDLVLDIDGVARTDEDEAASGS